MQQFTIPQFIDVEDKIIGPITARQFIIMLSGFVFLGIVYKFFDFSFFITATVIVLGLVALFSFVRINGRPFHFFLINLIQTFKRPKLRVWNKEQIQTEFIFEKTETKKNAAEEINFRPKILERSRLNELSLIVDTQGAYKGESDKGHVFISNLNNQE